MRGDKCSICGIEEGTIRSPNKHDPKRILKVRIVRHHKKYGDSDETVLYCGSCHKKAHNRINEKNLCPLSKEKRNKLSSKSTRSAIKSIEFTQQVGDLIRLREEIYYNYRTGNVGYSAFFQQTNGWNRYDNLQFIDELIPPELQRWAMKDIQMR